MLVVPIGNDAFINKEYFVGKKVYGSKWTLFHKSSGADC